MIQGFFFFLDTSVPNLSELLESAVLVSLTEQTLLAVTTAGQFALSVSSIDPSFWSGFDVTGTDATELMVVF